MDQRPKNRELNYPVKITKEQTLWNYYRKMARAAAQWPTFGNRDKARKAYEIWREEFLGGGI